MVKHVTVIEMAYNASFLAIANPLKYKILYLNNRNKYK